MSAITTHVLDTARGRPAAGIPIRLDHFAGHWQPLGAGETDPDGRLRTLLPDGPLMVGRYRISFDTAVYWARLGISGFYPAVDIVFEIAAPNEHYHVPLLLSPFGYSTFRGS